MRTPPKGCLLPRLRRSDVSIACIMSARTIETSSITIVSIGFDQPLVADLARVARIQQARREVEEGMDRLPADIHGGQARRREHHRLLQRVEDQLAQQRRLAGARAAGEEDIALARRRSRRSAAHRHSMMALPSPADCPPPCELRPIADRVAMISAPGGSSADHESNARTTGTLRPAHHAARDRRPGAAEAVERACRAGGPRRARRPGGAVILQQPASKRTERDRRRCCLAVEPAAAGAVRQRRCRLAQDRSGRRAPDRPQPQCEDPSRRATRSHAAANAGALLAGAQIVVDGPDSFATRFDVNAACHSTRSAARLGRRGSLERAGFGVQVGPHPGARPQVESACPAIAASCRKCRRPRRRARPSGSSVR